MAELRATRTSILDAAQKCVCGDREQDYGSPESNFQIIAELWNTYLSNKSCCESITAVDVGMMLALLKIARVASGRLKDDNFVDLAGYAACAGEIASRGLPFAEKEQIK